MVLFFVEYGIPNLIFTSSRWVQVYILCTRLLLSLLTVLAGLTFLLGPLAFSIQNHSVLPIVRVCWINAQGFYQFTQSFIRPLPLSSTDVGPPRSVFTKEANIVILFISYAPCWFPYSPGFLSAAKISPWWLLSCLFKKSANIYFIYSRFPLLGTYTFGNVLSCYSLFPAPFDHITCLQVFFGIRVPTATFFRLLLICRLPLVLVGPRANILHGVLSMQVPWF